jgi:hypothetical protein
MISWTQRFKGDPIDKTKNNMAETEVRSPKYRVGHSSLGLFDFKMYGYESG